MLLVLCVLVMEVGEIDPEFLNLGKTQDQSQQDGKSRDRSRSRSSRKSSISGSVGVRRLSFNVAV